MKRIILPEGYEPSEGEEYMGPLQLEYFFRQLEGWRHKLYHESAEVFDHLQDGELGGSDPSNRSSEEDQAHFESKRGARCTKLLKKVEEAIARIEDGTYGYCVEIGEKIGLARLKARPVATLSLRAQSKKEDEEHLVP